MGARAWLPYALGSAFFAGLTAVLGKMGVDGLDPDFATFVRTAVVLVMTLAIAAARGAWKPSEVTSRGLLFMTLSGLATGLSWLCYYRALRLGPASRVVPIDKLSVPVALALAAAFLGDIPSPRVAFGAALIVAGALVIAGA